MVTFARKSMDRLNIEQINATLKAKAVELGLCEQWQQMWNGIWDRPMMIAKYKEGIDFCLKNNFPTNDFIASNFTKQSLRKGGVFINDKYSVLNERVAVVRGNSEIIARYNGMAVSELYVADASVAYVFAKNNSHVIVHLLGNAEITASQNDRSTIVAIKHSKTCSVIPAQGSITIKEELDWLK